MIINFILYIIWITYISIKDSLSYIFMFIETYKKIITNKTNSKNVF